MELDPVALESVAEVTAASVAEDSVAEASVVDACPGVPDGGWPMPPGPADPASEVVSCVEGLMPTSSVRV